MPVTFNLDDELALQIQPVVMELRRQGYKGLSRTFLLNSGLKTLIKMYESKGVEAIVEIIDKDYRRKIKGEL